MKKPTLNKRSTPLGFGNVLPQDMGKIVLYYHKIWDKTRSGFRKE